MNREEWDARLLAFWQNEPLDEKEREEIRHWLQESEQHRCYYRQLQKSYLRQRWIMRELVKNGYMFGCYGDSLLMLLRCVCL